MNTPFRLLLIAVFFAAHAHAQKIPFINVREVLGRAAVLQDSGRFDDAIKELLSIPSRDTAYMLSQSRLARLYMFAKQYDMALATAQTVLNEKTPHRVSMLDVQVSAYEAQRQFDKAKAAATAAIKEFPFSAELLYDLAVVQQNSGDYVAATKTYHEILAVSPFTYNVHLNLANIALLNGQKTHAMMSLAIYIALVPSNNEMLKFLESIASNEVDNEGSESKVKIAGNAFERIDQILRSKIAMEKSFKTVVPVDAATVRQFEMIFKQLSAVTTSVKDDPWTKVYLPVYTAIRDQDLIEPFLNHILSSSSIESVKKWNEKNEKKRENFFNVVNNIFSDYRETIPVPSSLGLGSTAHAEYFDSQLIYGVGGKTNGQKTGKWIYYFENGERSAEGIYKDGKKSGEWRYFAENGNPSTNENEDTGEITSWFSHGAKEARYFVRNGKLEGELTFWFPCGNVKEKRMYADGKRHGKGQVFYQSGVVKIDFEYANDQQVNTWTEYYPSGRVKSKSAYKAGSQEGIEEIYWQNGKLKSKQTFAANKLNGPAEGYHANGALQSKGENVDGNARGEWLYYYPNGQKFERRFFNDAGLLEGDYIYYYNNKPGAVNVFKDGKLIGSTYYDGNGKEFSMTGSADGTFASKDYYETGQLFAEGSYKNGKLDGKWTTYYVDGPVMRVMNYENGLTHGEGKEFFRNGKLKSIANYVAGSEDGYGQTFYSNGQINSHGTSAAGEPEQQWVSYYPDGVVAMDQYFVNGTPGDTAYYYSNDGRLRMRSYYEGGELISQVATDPVQVNYFMDVKLNGEQVLKYANGSIQAKYNLACGQVNGKFERFYPDGKLYYNNGYANDQRNGEYVEYNESGLVVVQGRYESGEREGLWTYVNDFGKTEQVARYGNGSADSVVTDYYPFGALRKRSDYMNDQLHGVVRYFGSDGTPLVEKMYNHGALYSVRTTEKNGQFGAWKPFTSNMSVIGYYPNGNKGFEEKYEGGSISGVRRMYFPDGKVSEDFVYTDGDAHGPFAEYYPNGKVCRKGLQRFGELDGMIELFDENGLLLKSMTYKMGKKHGSTSIYSKGKKVKEIEFSYGFPVK